MTPEERQRIAQRIAADISDLVGEAKEVSWQELRDLVSIECDSVDLGEFVEWFADGLRARAEKAERELERRQRLLTELSLAIGHRSTEQISKKYGGNTPEDINGEVDDLTAIFRDLEKAERERDEAWEAVGCLASQLNAEPATIAAKDAEIARLHEDYKTQNAAIADQHDRIATLGADRARLVTEKDGAYEERNRLVAALSSVYPASLERHPDSDETWEDDWRWIVFIDLPTGQATWHIHDSHLSFFDHLPRGTGRMWDGHSTPEKYERVERLRTLAHPSRGEGECEYGCGRFRRKGWTLVHRPDCPKSQPESDGEQSSPDRPASPASGEVRG